MGNCGYNPILIGLITPLINTTGPTLYLNLGNGSPMGTGINSEHVHIGNPGKFPNSNSTEFPGYPSHRIHVWYIYLHLVDLYGKQIQAIHTSPGHFTKKSPRDHIQKLLPPRIIINITTSPVTREVRLIIQSGLRGDQWGETFRRRTWWKKRKYLT